MAEKLSKRECLPCGRGVPKLGAECQQRLLPHLHADWKIVDGHHLHRDYRFPDFVRALDFVNRVGRLAEEEGHHPDISLGYGAVGITIYTHKIDGLSENDFVLAAKIDELP